MFAKHRIERPQQNNFHHLLKYCIASIWLVEIMMQYINYKVDTKFTWTQSVMGSFQMLYAIGYKDLTFFRLKEAFRRRNHNKVFYAESYMYTSIDNAPWPTSICTCEYMNVIWGKWKIFNKKIGKLKSLGPINRKFHGHG